MESPVPISTLLQNECIQLFLQLNDTARFGKLHDVPESVEVSKFYAVHGDAHCFRNYYLFDEMVTDCTDASIIDQENPNCDLWLKSYEAQIAKEASGNEITPQLRSFSGNWYLALKLCHDYRDESSHIPDIVAYRNIISRVCTALERFWDEHIKNSSTKITLDKSRHQVFRDLLSIFTKPIRFSLPKRIIPPEHCTDVQTANAWASAQRPVASNVQTLILDTWDRVFMYYGWSDYLTNKFPKILSLLHYFDFEMEVPNPEDLTRRFATKKWSPVLYEIDRESEWKAFNQVDIVDLNQSVTIPDFWWGTESYRRFRNRQFTEKLEAIPGFEGSVITQPTFAERQRLIVSQLIL